MENLIPSGNSLTTSAELTAIVPEDANVVWTVTGTARAQAIRTSNALGNTETTRFDVNI